MSDAPKLSQVYLIDTETGERLVFQHNPAEISDSKDANYASAKIPGSSHPAYQFVSGEARKLAIKIELFQGDVKQQVRWLQSLAYPEYSIYTFKRPPHPITLMWGMMYAREQWIVKSVNVKSYYLFDPVTLEPRRADVDLALEEYSINPVDYQTIRTPLQDMISGLLGGGA